MTVRSLVAAAAVAVFAASSGAGLSVAADKTHPDWPCIQRKIENLAVSQMWDGPPIENLKWQDDDAITALIKVLATRKNGLDVATDAIKKYAAGLPEAERNAKLTMLFAGFFETLSAERRTIMSGIEKYNKSQRKRAGDIEESGKALADLEAKAAAASDDQKLAEDLQKAQDDYDWQTRIFKERNDNLPIACELPVLLDQRMFELAKVIRGEMKG